MPSHPQYVEIATTTRLIHEKESDTEAQSPFPFIFRAGEDGRRYYVMLAEHAGSG